MATTDPITGIVVQDQADAATGGFQLARLLTGLRTFVIARFASATARDTAYSSSGETLADGMACYVPNRFLVRRGGEWVKQGGLVELLYANADAGSSGEVQTGQSLPVLSVNLPAPGVASDRAFVEVRAVVTPAQAGASAGSVSVTYGGVTRTKVYNALSQNAPEAVEFAFPASAPAGTHQLGVILTVGGGVKAKLDHSSIHVNV